MAAGGACGVGEPVQQPAPDPAPAVRRCDDELTERVVRVVQQGEREQRNPDRLRPGAGRPRRLGVAGLARLQPSVVLHPARRWVGGHVVRLRRREDREPVAQRAFVVGRDGVEGDGGGEFDHDAHRGTRRPRAPPDSAPPGPVAGDLLG
ncbi:hypothetical protein GCM10023320_26800 [Pseudonocardia adelaidensis]|uniref:Uncharacterized protein n=1 Tax=Pseudonocardia adelaidensis TaxID=648754 RepID=A0ABP9NNT6_9PSEU